MRGQLSRDPAKALSSLATILGEPVRVADGVSNAKQGDAQPAEEASPSLPTEELHTFVVDAICRRIQRSCQSSLCFVLNGTDIGGTEEALDAAVMLALTTYARSGRGQSSSTEVIGRTRGTRSSERSGGNTKLSSGR